MNVSHFELVWKPQSPAAPTGTAAVDQLIQGYFLEITNLEDKTIEFSLQLRAAVAADPLRSLAGNAIVFVDTPGANNQQGVLNGAVTGTAFFPSTGAIVIPAGGTALVAVLPSAFGPLPGETTPLTLPNFEVRGYVTLTVPALLQRQPGPFTGALSFVRQSETPVKVLLTPQNRTTYFMADGSISDQTQASLPTANGKAEAEIVAQGSPFFRPLVPRFDLSRLEDLQRDPRFVDGPDIEGLAVAMAVLSGDEAARKRMNDAMAEVGIGIALEARKAKATGKAKEPETAS